MQGEFCCGAQVYFGVRFSTVKSLKSKVSSLLAIAGSPEGPCKDKYVSYSLLRLLTGLVTATLIV
jgi:hypothetical protein